jgi:hypothetical protein
MLTRTKFTERKESTPFLDVALFHSEDEDLISTVVPTWLLTTASKVIANTDVLKPTRCTRPTLPIIGTMLTDLHLTSATDCRFILITKFLG